MHQRHRSISPNVWSFLTYAKSLPVSNWLKGLVDGSEGVYRATPLGRLNACLGMATPLAQQAYEEFTTT